MDERQRRANGQPSEPEDEARLDADSEGAKPLGLDEDLQVAVDSHESEIRTLDGNLQVAIDFDGVLFDQSAHIRERFHEIHGVDIGPVDEWPWNLSEHPPVREAGLTSDDTWEVFHSVHNDPELHHTEPVDAHCRRVLDALLGAGHQVDVVTARSPESREPTELFLDRNEIPHERLIMGDHEKTGWDVLLDDLPHHVRRVADDGSLGLLMDQPYNRDFTAEDNPYRVDGFAHVAELLGLDG